MADPSLPLQAAFVAALRALGTTAGARVYDIVPRGPLGITAQFPFWAFGSPDTFPIDEDCGDRTDTTIVLDFWSRAMGFPEAKAAAALAHDRFHEGALTITGHTVDRMRVERTEYIRDKDGLTSRARMTINIETSAS